MLSGATGLALAQSDKALEAKKAAWLAKQPAATQRALRAQMREWKTCYAKFGHRSATAEAAIAAKLNPPKFYKISTAGWSSLQALQAYARPEPKFFHAILGSLNWVPRPVIPMTG